MAAPALSVMHKDKEETMWLDKIRLTESLFSIFGTIEIDNSANLLRVDFDNSSVSLSFNLVSWPDNPPKKWIERKANTVQCKMVLAGCSETELKNWAPDNFGEFRIEPLGNGALLVEFIAESGFYLSCVCEEAAITNVSAYQQA